MTVDARAWLDRFATLLGAEPPTDDQIEALLALAGVAAHASERTAAPLSCWLAAIGGVAPADALVHAKQLADQLAGTDSAN
ncbi:MAG: DUF6457 domain-containing protein [Actinomycetota bacterium]|jgi:hypothetical protein|nr:DUF6457 domain-containing protein [Actinomycetota bacterium]MDA8077118.1 DUF6457 domain-containing protein [Actinomycetota bacterium]